MRFVHSLVTTQIGEKKGWCAPIELGEDAPHYISFAVVKKGRDSFLRTVDGIEVWFVVRPVSPKERRLPYIGNLKHPDFALPFAEIEPENPAMLDQLFLEQSIGILGCDPFTHYEGLMKMGA